MKLPEELKQPDRRILDDAVFELLGVTGAKERSDLVDRLYEETTRHFRDVRITEIQKMEDRRTGGTRWNAPLPTESITNYGHPFRRRIP
mgnify:CR=1 FL=1